MHLLATLQGPPVGFALTGAKADERQALWVWVWVRVLQRIPALTAAIWHNDHTGQPTKRSLVAYDH